MKKYLLLLSVIVGWVACATQPEQAATPVALVTLSADRVTKTAVPPTTTPLSPPTSTLFVPVEANTPAFVTTRPYLEEYDPFEEYTSPTLTPTPQPTATPTVPPIWIPPALHPLAISPGNVEQIVEITQLGRGTIHKMALSPDGQTIVVSGGLGVWLYDLETFELIQFIGQPYIVNTVVWSPDGTRLVWGTEDSTVHVWDVTTGEELHTWDGFNSPIWSLSWSPDGQRIAAGTVKGGLWLWQADTGQLLHQLGIGEYGRVWDIAWSPDSTQLASAHEDDIVRIWDTQGGVLLATYDDHHIPDAYYGGATIYHGVLSIAWSPDGQLMASSGSDDHKLRIWSIQTGEETAEFYPRSAVSVHRLAWSPDGSKLALGAGDTGGGVGILDLGSLEEQTLTGGHFKPVHSLAWLPDGGGLLSAGLDSTVKVWDVESGESLQILSGYTKPVWGMAWSPDAMKLATSDNDVSIWDVSTQELVGVSLNRVYIWEATNWLELRSIEFGNGVLSVAFSPNGRYLAFGMADGTVRLWGIP